MIPKSRQLATAVQLQPVQSGPVSGLFAVLWTGLLNSNWHPHPSPPSCHHYHHTAGIPGVHLPIDNIVPPCHWPCGHLIIIVIGIPITLVGMHVYLPSSSLSLLSHRLSCTSNPSSHHCHLMHMHLYPSHCHCAAMVTPIPCITSSLLLSLLWASMSFCYYALPLPSPLSSLLSCLSIASTAIGIAITMELAMRTIVINSAFPCHCHHPPSLAHHRHCHMHPLVSDWASPCVIIAACYCCHHLCHCSLAGISFSSSSCACNSYGMGVCGCLTTLYRCVCIEMSGREPVIVKETQMGSHSPMHKEVFLGG